MIFGRIWRPGDRPFPALKLLYGTLFQKYSHGSKNNSVRS